MTALSTRRSVGSRSATGLHAVTTPPPPSPTLAYWLLGLVTALCVLGLVMVLSASSVQALSETGSTWTYFLRQSAWLGLGTAALVTCARTDQRWWRRAAGPLLLGSWVLLVVVLIPGIGIEVNGARSWLGWGPLRFQPSEPAKLALLVFSADLLARRSSRMHDGRATLRPIVVVGAVTVLLMMLQPDLGTTMVLGSILLAVLFVAGVPLLRFAGVLVGGSALALALGLWAPYRRDRILSFLHPGDDPMNTGYQLVQSLTGVASGGWTGVGLGASRAKWGFLPNAHTDFIFAIIAEELGLVGAAVVVALFLALAVTGTRVALGAHDRFGVLVAAGATAWLLAQALVNIGGTVGLLPITGLPLPFVSAGGSSLVVAMAATGILVNIARPGRREGRRYTA